MRIITSACFGFAAAVSAFALTGAPTLAVEVPAITTTVPANVIRVQGERCEHVFRECRERHGDREHEFRECVERQGCEHREGYREHEREEREARERREHCEHVRHECRERHGERHEYRECVERELCEY